MNNKTRFKIKKNKLIKSHNDLKERQEIISLIMRKWTDYEIKNYLSNETTLKLSNEDEQNNIQVEIKKQILDRHNYLFNKDELSRLHKIKTKIKFN